MNVGVPNFLTIKKIGMANWSDTEHAFDRNANQQGLLAECFNLFVWIRARNVSGFAGIRTAERFYKEVKKDPMVICVSSAKK